MFGNVSAERRAIEATYEDTAVVMRTAPVTGDNNITRNVPSVVLQDVICGLSYIGSDRSRQTKAQNEIDYDAVIFFRPEDAVQPGDMITLKRFGRDNPGSTHLLGFEVIGQPPVYATHQEVRVKEARLV